MRKRTKKILKKAESTLEKQYLTFFENDPRVPPENRSVHSLRPRIVDSFTTYSVCEEPVPATK
jgi:hypothetical protein